MSFQWFDYAELASRLAQGKSPTNAQAACRSAVSRAYYAAYNLAFRYCCRYGYDPHGDGRDHYGVRAYLEDRLGMRLAAYQLLELSRHRKSCDYEDLLQGDVAAMATRSVMLARGLITAFENPPPTALIQTSTLDT